VYGLDVFEREVLGTEISTGGAMVVRRVLACYSFVDFGGQKMRRVILRCSGEA
jgi:hypothetical protein